MSTVTTTKLCPDLPVVSGVSFKTNPQYPGYVFGTDGSVWSCRKVGARAIYGTKWHQLKPTTCKKGMKYQTVAVRKSGERKRRTFFVHRLILETYIGLRPLGKECCHSNGDASDNRPENLRWDTPASNTEDKRKHGVISRGTNCPQAKLTEISVVELRRLRREGKKANELAVMFGLCVRNINRAITRKTWSHVP